MVHSSTNVNTSKEQKIFLLGVGCQKGGTTWLHDYLNKHPNVDMGFAKEYHFFDTLYIKDSQFFNQWKQQLKKIIQNNFDSALYTNIVQKVNFCEDQNLYYDYFEKLLMNSSIRVTGDITPSYAALKAPAFKVINNNFKNRGIKVKVIFLMRDPVHRIWSAYNMNMVKQNAVGNFSISFSDFILKKGVVSRTTYDKTIFELEKYFDQDQLFFGFYEELFKSEHTLRQLVKFLGISFRPPNFKKIINEGSGNRDIPHYFANQIKEKFSPTYAYVINKFGGERIGNIWEI